MSHISTHDARITTVQVEIQALKIGRKQMTLSIFRQLPLDDLVDYATTHLRGVPWGWVNYWWEGCGASWGQIHDGAVLHVVWQDGEKLKRSICEYHCPSPRVSPYFVQAWVQQFHELKALPQLFIAV
jgi:hypothetical protein